ncbi:hypothetical protein MGN01_03070 [Methylobacterium gnaphalii]|uniref:Uncharacterized protein n=1 Tax=Methylobacterium gnaphalii TaxID=1010610 RepID=A0A512JEW0_9HYPH|nr:hypothetical protein MGN01_03070 [Methylobacterium gnaphalii]GLS47350.1 hypothetical protein GCM10007885_01940 [Methylobacterium gnaphalii]
MCLAFAGLVGVGGLGAPVLARGTSAQPQPAPAQPTPAAAAQPAPAAAPGSAGRASGLRGAEKRRRSYASCNRESRNRSLRGGARRRFLIRCRLGYERRRPGQPTTQGAQPQTLPPPVARPNPPQNQIPAKPVQPPSQPQPQSPAKRP